MTKRRRAPRRSRGWCAVVGKVSFRSAGDAQTALDAAVAAGDLADRSVSGRMHIYPCPTVPAGDPKHWHFGGEIPRRFRRVPEDAPQLLTRRRVRGGDRIVVDPDASLEELQAAAQRARGMA